MRDEDRAAFLFRQDEDLAGASSIGLADFGVFGRGSTSPRAQRLTLP